MQPWYGLLRDVRSVASVPRVPVLSLSLPSLLPSLPLPPPTSLTIPFSFTFFTPFQFSFFSRKRKKKKKLTFAGGVLVPKTRKTVVFTLVCLARRTMRSVDEGVRELDSLRYRYKGA
jgi:hypothetical protein